jgi:hypothetical protein
LLTSAWREIWDRSGVADTRSLAGWVAFVGALVAGAIGWHLWGDWNFEFSNPREIYGAVWLHRYPKQQDLAAYVLALVSVAAGVALSRAVWCALSLTYSHLRSRDASRALRDTAIGSLIAIPLLPTMFGYAWSAFHPLWGLTGVIDAGQRRRRHGRVAGAVQFVVIPAILYLCFYEETPIWRLPIELFEEGASLAPLQSVLNGGTVYRDGYLQHGLFHNLGKPLLASQLEISLVALRKVNAWFAPLGPLALFVLGLSVFLQPIDQRVRSAVVRAAQSGAHRLRPQTRARGRRRPATRIDGE